jgi:wyosine [tRNA(Phe)-imidazoG37] synthetase (radical SAM superfamily)
LDAPTTELACRINRPQGKYDVGRVVAGMKRFEGDFILQTMFLRARDFDSSSPEVLLPWMDIVRDLHPREIMAYTIARPTPQAGLTKFSVEEMAAMLRPLIEEGFNLKIYG